MGINVAAGIKWKQGDVVITSDREHNSNLVPWLQQSTAGLKLQTVKSRPDNTFDLERFEAACAEAGKSLRMVSLVHVGNLDGVKIPITEASKIAHDHGAIVHVDGAQSAPHMPINVNQLECDLFSFSLHKMLGPTGVGALWGREDFGKVARGTAAWVINEMQSVEGGYFSTIDADSEGVEGRYYVWDATELKDILDPKAWCFASALWGLTNTPNFEGRWLINQVMTPAAAGQTLHL